MFTPSFIELMGTVHDLKSKNFFQNESVFFLIITLLVALIWVCTGSVTNLHVFFLGQKRNSMCLQECYMKFFHMFWRIADHQVFKMLNPTAGSKYLFVL